MKESLTLHEVIRKFALEKIRGNPEISLVTIQAPAGSGKSTLLRQLRNSISTLGHRHAWVEKVERSDDVAFAIGLLKAFHSQQKDSEIALAGFDDDLRDITDRLIRSVRSVKAPCHILIDDFHQVKSPATVQLLTRLAYLEKPVPVTLVIASRVHCDIPVSQLQLEGRHLELGPDDLKFSRAEAETLRDVGAIAVDPYAWKRFWEKVDGWAVALRLAAILLREFRLDVSGLLDFTGTQREMARYLSEKLFEGLSETEQNLLFKAAAFDILRHDLLCSVLGRDKAEHLMELVKRLALPSDTIEGKMGGIRLHSIVSDFLSSRARVAGIALEELQHKAADFLRSKGEWRKAINYALKTGDIQLAADISEQAGGWRLIYRGEEGTLNQYFELFALSRSDFPKFPRTALGLAIAAAKRGEIDHATDLLNSVSKTLDRSDKDIVAELRLVRALLALYRDSAIQADEVALLENDILDDSEMDSVRAALTQNLLCFSSLQVGNFDTAIRYGRLSAATFRAAGSEFGAAHLPLHIGQAEYFSGRIDNASATFKRHLEYCEKTLGAKADLTWITHAFHIETDIEQWGQSDHSTLIEKTLARLGSSDSWYDPLASLVLSRNRLALVRGDLWETERALADAEEVAQARNYQRLSRLIKLLRIEGLIRARQFDEARVLIKLFKAEQLERTGDMSYDEVNIRGLPITALEADLLLQTDGKKEANDLLDVLLADPGVNKNVPRLIRLALLKLKALDAIKQTEEAVLRLKRLTLTQPVDRYRLPFLESGENTARLIGIALEQADADSLIHRRLTPVMSALKELHPGMCYASSSGLHLTETEQKVILLLERGKPNKVIGRELDISDNTVKYHVANIFRKLDVNTRTAAVTQAREAGILAAIRLR